MRKLRCVTVILLFSVSAANATISLADSGTSAKGVEVLFKAELTISGDELTVVLINDSPVDTLNPDDLLGSFYFDIVNGDNERPLLNYASAAGDVYAASKTSPDALVQADAGLVATSPGDGTWQFVTADEMVNPYMAFGLGTVGNSALSPNNFSGNLVGGMDYAIYAGEITTQNLNGKLLVKDMATFTFTGLTGFSEADISPQFAFGLGTAPDSLLTPEPSTMVLLGLGSLLLWKRRSL